MQVWNPGYTEFMYFWGEWPFSQWSESKFTVNEIEYNTAEQFMMASKARHFKDFESEKLILESIDPKLQKKLGRGVKNFDASEWNSVSKDYVYLGNYHKFTQNEAAKKALMETDGMLLVEASPYDKIWGVGLSAFDAKCGKPWQGTNWLGEVLTKLREDLKNDI